MLKAFGISLRMQKNSKCLEKKMFSSVHLETDTFFPNTNAISWVQKNKNGDKNIILV